MSTHEASSKGSYSFKGTPHARYWEYVWTVLISAGGLIAVVVVGIGHRFLDVLAAWHVNPWETNLNLCGHLGLGLLMVITAVGSGGRAVLNGASAKEKVDVFEDRAEFLLSDVGGSRLAVPWSSLSSLRNDPDALRIETDGGGLILLAIPSHAEREQLLRELKAFSATR